MTTYDLMTARHTYLSGLRGGVPGQRAQVAPEHVLRDQLARALGGIVEVVLPYGRADVADERYVIEVEPAKQWRHGVMQVLAYSAQCDRLPGLALFGSATPDEVLRVYLRLRDGTPSIALWWHTGWDWKRIGGRSACRTMQEWPILDGSPIHFR